EFKVEGSVGRGRQLQSLGLAIAVEKKITVGEKRSGQRRSGDRRRQRRAIASQQLVITRGEFVEREVTHTPHRSLFAAGIGSERYVNGGNLVATCNSSAYPQQIPDRWLDVHLGNIALELDA